MQNEINHQLRDLKFEQRLEQAALVCRHDDLEQRAGLATAMIRELAMHRVFDRFTKEQQEKLLDLLQPLANPPGTKTHLAFGNGAFWNVPSP